MKFIKLEGFYVNPEEIAVYAADRKLPHKTNVWFRSGAVEGGEWQFDIDVNALTGLLVGNCSHPRWNTQPIDTNGRVFVQCLACGVLRQTQ